MMPAVFAVTESPHDSAHHQFGTTGVLQELLRDRTQQQSGEIGPQVLTHDDQIDSVTTCIIDNLLCWVSLQYLEVRFYALGNDKPLENRLATADDGTVNSRPTPWFLRHPECREQGRHSI
jgi:hypothetical protein